MKNEIIQKHLSLNKLFEGQMPKKELKDFIKQNKAFIEYGQEDELYSKAIKIADEFDSKSDDKMNVYDYIRYIKDNLKSDDFDPYAESGTEEAQRMRGLFLALQATGKYNYSNEIRPEDFPQADATAKEEDDEETKAKKERGTVRIDKEHTSPENPLVVKYNDSLYTLKNNNWWKYEPNANSEKKWWKFGSDEKSEYSKPEGVIAGILTDNIMDNESSEFDPFKKAIQSMLDYNREKQETEREKLRKKQEYLQSFQGQQDQALFAKQDAQQAAKARQDAIKAHNDKVAQAKDTVNRWNQLNDIKPGNQQTVFNLQRAQAELQSLMATAVDESADLTRIKTLTSRLLNK